MLPLYFIFISSIIIQVMSTFLAFRLINTTRHYRAWLFLGLAVGLMAVRRIVSFYSFIRAGESASVNTSAEVVALSISVLMLIGIINIRPIIKSLYAAKSELEKNNQRLEDEIEHRRSAEKKAINNEQKFRKIVNVLPQFVSYLNKECIFQFVNATHLNFFNLSEDQIIGQKLSDIIGWEAYEKEKPYLNRVWNGEMVHHEGYFDFPGRKTAYMEATFIPELSQTGEVDGFYAVLSDITDKNENQRLLEESRNRLRILSEHQQEMLEKERSYIAREIHDELGQNLTAISMALAMMKKQLPRDNRNLFTKIHEMSQLTQSTLEKTKRLSSELRPQLIDDMGLIAAIEWYVKNFEKRSAITCNVSLPDTETDFPKDLAIHIYRIVQESLTNVYKHASATYVELVLKTENGMLLLMISDSGKGIEGEDAQKNESLGIMGIEERVRLMNGNFTIKNTGQGTSINIKIPYNR